MGFLRFFRSLRTWTGGRGKHLLKEDSCLTDLMEFRELAIPGSLVYHYWPGRAHAAAGAMNCYA